MSYFKYGTHQHPLNETNLVSMRSQIHMSPRGRRLAKTVRMELLGELQYTGTELLSKITEMENAYSIDYQNAGLFLDDGTPTPHQLDNNSSISGVRVRHRNFPKGDGAELATKRTYHVILEALYDVAETELVFWSEELRFIGNGGPRIVVIDTYSGPLSMVVATATAQQIIQSGRAIGYAAYVLPPGPIFPAVEHQDVREVALRSGKNQGLDARFFGTEWIYRMTSAVPLEAAPQTR